MTDRRIIRWPALREVLGGRSRSQIDRDERAGKFPLRVQVGEHAVGWFLDEVLACLESRERGRGSPPKAAIRANPHHRRKRTDHPKAEREGGRGWRGIDAVDRAATEVGAGTAKTGSQGRGPGTKKVAGRPD